MGRSTQRGRQRNSKRPPKKDAPPAPIDPEKEAELQAELATLDRMSTQGWRFLDTALHRLTSPVPQTTPAGNKIMVIDESKAPKVIQILNAVDRRRDEAARQKREIERHQAQLAAAARQAASQEGGRSATPKANPFGGVGAEDGGA